MNEPILRLYKKLRKIDDVLFSRNKSKNEIVACKNQLQSIKRECWELLGDLSTIKKKNILEIRKILREREMYLKIA